MRRRLKTVWRAFSGGDLGPVGWCGQVGYWWTRPCGHLAAGCGWFDGEKVVREETHHPEGALKEAWWCEEHNGWIEEAGDDCVLSLEGRLGRCHQVQMRLVPISALDQEKQ